ncbi:MAG TPA: SCO family protein [Bacteroidota bacterium]|nr:SCO family protein [Bacteroidota bacterium]
MAVAVLIIIGSSFTFWHYLSTYHPPMPVYGNMPYFSLTSQENRPVSAHDFDGKVVIADFIFTSCAGPCPMMSSRMKEIQSDLADDPSIRLVSFSVDPETDTPPVLAEYAHQYGADNTRWTFLTGDKRTILGMTKTNFHLAVENDSGAIAHSTKFVLVDKHSNIRGYYDSDEIGSMNKLLADAKLLAKER